MPNLAGVRHIPNLTGVRHILNFPGVHHIPNLPLLTSTTGTWEFHILNSHGVHVM